MSREERVGSDASGFALILAILALMLLTFLGLTLATTSSTELQIATNYRWSQQALYNAEAGLQVARIILSNSSDPATGLEPLLPPARLVPWAPNAYLPLGTNAGGYPPGTRDLEGGGGAAGGPGVCDTRGGAGYGRVLSDGTVPQGYENQSAFLGQPLNGAFTIWIKREVLSQTDGLYVDNRDNNVAVITVEGVAPYTAAAPGAVAAANQAVRVLETTLTLANTIGSNCETMQGQIGLGPAGDNAQTCGPITQSGVRLPTAAP